MEFVGQSALIKALNSYSASNLPKTMLFLGDYGCGKHTVANMLVSRLNLELNILDNKVTRDELLDIQQKPVEAIYLVDLATFTDKQQNILLKFIEEPSPYIFIILIAESEANILDTILNRCIKFKFESYSKEELSKIKLYENDLIYKVCNTPGQLKVFNETVIEKLYNICHLIVTRLNNSTFANVMKIPSMINYKDSYDKPDLKTFFKMMEYVSFEEFKNKHSLLAFNFYKITKEYQKNMLNKNLVKENYMINYITRLWEEAYYGNYSI